MAQLPPPLISIIMPVYNTGIFLTDAINSVLNQQPVTDCAVPSFELVVVDDHSTDSKTLEILGDASRLDPRIHVISNQRKKGAAGARNTGIMSAIGTWIGFLDSDDIWFPNSLALRWHGISNNKEVRWSGAKFRLLRPTINLAGQPAFESLENLTSNINQNTLAPNIVCLSRPVEEFGKSCMIGIMTVLIQRTLILEKGLFNEQLQRSEDYHLWFKCAFDTDLWMIDSDVAFYRIHPGSLTHGKQPKFLFEDKMVELLLLDKIGITHKNTLLNRFDLIMQDSCYFYREKKIFNPAFTTALKWIKRRPCKLSAWKELIASGLKIG